MLFKRFLTFTIVWTITTQIALADLVIFEWVDEMLTEEEAKLKKQYENFNSGRQIKITPKKPSPPQPIPQKKSQPTPEEGAHALTALVLSLGFLMFGLRIAWKIKKDIDSWGDSSWH